MAQTLALLAGAARVDITPSGSMFLHGYPHVLRYSTGVHDPLLSSALYLESGDTRVLIIANDVIYVSKASVARCRARIAERTDIPADHVMISATHTHSGPKMLDPVAMTGDSVVPSTDPAYVMFVENKIVEAAERAVQSARPAEAGLAVADATGVGTNRRNPDGPRDLDVPVLVVRDASDHRPIAAMLVCSMHPTVLHEDSTLVSGDFPAMTRKYLQDNVLGQDCVVLYHTGPAGNQSPRRVTRANTFEEAERLGRILGSAAERVIPTIEYRREMPVKHRRAVVELPLRTFLPEDEARAKLAHAAGRLESLRQANAPRVEVRTAEVDWFGAEETLTLARAHATGVLQQAARAAMPAEVQVIRVGDWSFVAWPGEMFIEFAIDVKQRCGRDRTFLISYANGELQGYLVTREAADEGGYEASNGIFKSPESGEMIVAKTIELLEGE